jgi:hypothetical protein
MADKFCSACGAPLSGKYCSACGASTGGMPRRSHQPGRWWAAGGFLLLAVSALILTVRKERSRAVSGGESVPAAAPEAESPPDLSTMTARERFDRLYNRVMRAAEQGDSATVLRFSPMAFAAYDQLDSVDADARYHVAVLRLHVQGDTASALRLADAILQERPGHLFGFLIRGMAGRLVGDEALLRRATADFLAAWDAEIKSGRPEYRDHQAMLDQFRASSGRTGKPQQP